MHLYLRIHEHHLLPSQKKSPEPQKSSYLTKGNFKFSITPIIGFRLTVSQHQMYTEMVRSSIVSSLKTFCSMLKNGCFMFRCNARWYHDLHGL